MDIYENITENSKYEINKLGKIRRQYINGNITYPKCYLGKNGYYSVSIHNKHYTVHRLLGLQFIPNPNNLPMIDHIDRNRLNNSLDNLRWVSCSENNKNRTQKGCVCKTTEKYKDKEYIYYRCFWYENQKKKSKRFKTEAEAEIFRNNIFMEM